MMSELEDTRDGRVHYNLECMKDIVHLACLASMVEDVVASFF